MRLILFAFIVTLAACATPQGATANAAPAADTRACVTAAGGDTAAQRACIGEAAGHCMENTPGGDTTVGMMQCAQAEEREWEALRDAQIAELRATETPSQLALLDAALAQFAQWAPARCAYEASIYEGGSLARVVGASCMRDAMAEYALSLVNRHAEP